MKTMNKTFTHENLLLLIYDEIRDPLLEQAIRDEIRNDNALYEEFVQLTETKHQIEKSLSGPSENAIQSILSYAKAIARVDVAEPQLRLMHRN